MKYKIVIAFFCFLIALFLAFGTNFWDVFVFRVDSTAIIKSQEIFLLSNGLFFVGLFLFSEGNLKNRYKTAFDSSFGLYGKFVHAVFDGFHKPKDSIETVTLLKTIILVALFLFLIVWLLIQGRFNDAINSINLITGPFAKIGIIVAFIECVICLVLIIQIINNAIRKENGQNPKFAQG